MERLFPVFARLANKSTGLCNLEGFASNLNVHITEPVLKIFSLFDIVGHFLFISRYGWPIGKQNFFNQFVLFLHY
jgi:hypothetical protein